MNSFTLSIRLFLSVLLVLVVISGSFSSSLRTATAASSIFGFYVGNTTFFPPIKNTISPSKMTAGAPSTYATFPSNMTAGAPSTYATFPSNMTAGAPSTYATFPSNMTAGAPSTYATFPSNMTAELLSFFI